MVHTVKKEMKTIGKKFEVYAGKAHHTQGGLKKKDLVKNKSGKIVSLKQQQRGHALAKKFPPRLTQAPLFTKRR